MLTDMVKSKFIALEDVKMHYLEEGDGDPILFLHGIPTSSYLWRNIIPMLSAKAHCIALDLIGMGQSEKPDISYTFFDHLTYVEKFITTLGLKNITLVLHGFGSALGFDYAMRHQDSIKAIAFYESHVRPANSWDMLALPIQQILHPLLDNPDKAYDMVTRDNSFLDQLINSASLSKLSNKYSNNFVTEHDRKPIWQYIQDFSCGENKQKVLDRIASYSQKLCHTTIPKLLFYNTPGFITTMATVEWCRDNLQNLQLVDLEEGLHFAPESSPKLFAEILRDWYTSLPDKC